MPLKAFRDAPVNEAVFLSRAAYQGNTAGNLENYLLDGEQNNPSDGNWNLKLLPGAATSGADRGYYRNSNAVAFAAEKDGTLAVAITGTELKELSVDFSSASYTPLAHYNDLLQFINAAITHANTNSNINKILITGHSLGGQAAELFAVDPTKAVIQDITASPQTGGAGLQITTFDPRIAGASAQTSQTQSSSDIRPKDELQRPMTSQVNPDSNKFHNGDDVSIITFGSPGIPKSVNDLYPAKYSHILSIYNSDDPVYNIFFPPLTANDILSQEVVRKITLGSGTFKEYAHIGTQRPLVIPGMDDLLSPDLYPSEHRLENYQTFIEAVNGSYLSNFATEQTILVFGGSNVSLSTNDIIAVGQIGSDANKQHFLLGLGGNDVLIGGTTNDLLDGGLGDDVMNGGPGGDYYAISGNDKIESFNFQEDALWMPGVFGSTITGTFNAHSPSGGDTLLKYPGGTLTLVEFDLRPWVDWM